MLDETLMPQSFLAVLRGVRTRNWSGTGVEAFLRDYGPPEYHSAEEYERAVGSPFPPGMRPTPANSRPFETDPNAETLYLAPRERARAAYNDVLDHFHLDGLVYPAVLMPPPDETVPPYAEPHSNTGWINPLGVPAVAVPAGFYANGLPFGLEISARRWADADLLGWAYSYEQSTKHRRPPSLVASG